MNSTVTDSLSREKVRQLLAAVGSMPTDDRTKIEATEYDWRQPHYFSREQLASLDSFAKNLAAAVAEKFAQLYHSDFDVTTVSTTQHFAGELLGQISGSKTSDYYLAFGPDQKHLCGFISIPEQTAIAWVTQLLGEAESDPPMADRKAGTQEDSAETLSQLEESLLVDIAAAIVAALSVSVYALPQGGGPQSYSFEPARTIVRGELPRGQRSELPVELQQLEELCKIVFAVRRAGSENSSQTYLVVPCSTLAPVAGKAVNPAGKSSAEDMSKAIIGHLHRMPVSITAQLARTYLTFQELVAVRPCDILLLDKAIDESVELIVDGRTLFRGRPAKSAGQYAIVITESLS